VTFSTSPQDIFYSSRRHLTCMRAILRIALAALVLACMLSAGAQDKPDKKGGPELRTIHGSTIDKSENPVPSAVVYLLNVKSQAVKTYIADDAGNYRFSGLDPNVDYEVHAEHEDSMSATRTVSSFDSRRDVEIVLKLSRKKPAR
jgi:Carboxypeptidase regulatory-like domain